MPSAGKEESPLPQENHERGPACLVSCQRAGGPLQGALHIGTTQPRQVALRAEAGRLQLPSDGCALSGRRRVREQRQPMVEMVESLAERGDAQRLAAGIVERTGSLKRQPAGLIVPGEPRAQPLALPRVVPNLLIQVRGNVAMELRPLDRVQLVVDVLLKQVMRKAVDGMNPLRRQACGRHGRRALHSLGADKGVLAGEAAAERREHLVHRQAGQRGH